MNLFTLIAHRCQASFRSMGLGQWVFLAFGTILLSLVLTLTMMVRSEEGILKGVGLIRGNDALWSNASMALDGLRQNEESAPSAQEDPGALLEQAEEIAAALNPEQLPLIEWLYRLEKNRITDRDLVVFIKPWTELSERQKTIFSVQGIDVQPWSEGMTPPERLDSFEDRSQFWIQKTHQKRWVIHAVMADMMAVQSDRGYTLTDLDLIRVILWSDELVQEKIWQDKNPPPSPPAELIPSRITIQIIPSTIGIVSMFWISAGFVLIFVSLWSMFFGVATWENLRKEGVFEVFAALPFESSTLVRTYLGAWGAFMMMMVFASSLGCAAILLSFDIPVPVFDLVKVSSMMWGLGLFVMAFSVMVSSWWPQRWWRLWTFVLMTLGALVIEILYVSFFSQGHIIVSLLSNVWSWFLITAVLIGFWFVLTKICAWRLDRNYRLGFKK